MKPLFERSLLIFDEAGITRLQNAHVLVAGVGGVGGFVIEALARAGIGELTIIDHDQVSPSNLNRQIIALESTVGLNKVDVMKDRILLINPDCKVNTLASFITPEAMPELLTQSFSCVVDAIDSLNCKVALVKAACDAQVPVFSSMGAGRRTDPSKVMVSRLDNTHTCGLARNMRQRLNKHKTASKIPVVFSTELPLPPGPMEDIEGARGRVVNGTASYMPGIFGLMLGGLVINYLVKEDNKG
ncbi:tRNA threonylcarbamoyladenosine dehydratase [Thiosulfativibrio zosterae]|uniref:tRNA threonylcarbamoyladenosine dehydratase n=1 Tax=Thiosulfativibrio zosterae TaxID=2675053 RepID=A0A6F8PL12_9GAMM|nr:tRNA threonylcarbamoyladenosine dehydratase [Thiosulfativibrio zosterae]BBP42737.1 tRNA threonylcarbamoyladenosine dehydratase [Thiosulfativibrio zosterae]